MQDHEQQGTSETIGRFIFFDRIAVLLSIGVVLVVNALALQVTAVYLIVPILGVLAVVLTVAGRQSARRKAESAVWLVAAGHWFVTVLIVVILPFIWPVLVLTVLMPLVLATPLLRRSALRVAIVVSTLVVGAVAALGLVLDDDGAIEDIPDELELVVVIAALAAQVVPIALITRHNNTLQLESLNAAEELNAALRASERSLAESRRRLVEVGDEERRRLERDLHDGAQQRLLALGMRLRLLRSSASDPAVQQRVDDAIAEMESAVAELRELAHGIYPSLLQSGGLPGALRSIARSLPMPVDVSVDDIGRRDETTEASCWFIVREALANITKHANAQQVWLELREEEDERFCIEVSDDGVGIGVDAVDAGLGLVSMHDRAGIIDADLQVRSRPGGGTTLSLVVPPPNTT